MPSVAPVGSGGLPDAGQTTGGGTRTPARLGGTLRGRATLGLIAAALATGLTALLLDRTGAAAVVPLCAVAVSAALLHARKGAAATLLGSLGLYLAVLGGRPASLAAATAEAMCVLLLVAATVAAPRSRTPPAGATRPALIAVAALSLPSVWFGILVSNAFEDLPLFQTLPFMLLYASAMACAVAVATRRLQARFLGPAAAVALGAALVGVVGFWVLVALTEGGHGHP